MEVRTEVQARFGEQSAEKLIKEEEERILEKAMGILRERIRKGECRYFVGNKEDVCRYLGLELGEKKEEYFGVLLLNAMNGVMEDFRPFRGGVSSCPVAVSGLIKRALEIGASAMVVYHNHPSGVAKPSEPDRKLTEVIGEGCRIMQISLLDHLIIGGGSVYSFAEHEEI